jgi:N-acyl-phosphatidylethanolamine-hydrolysing phospholipase D
MIGVSRSISINPLRLRSLIHSRPIQRSYVSIRDVILGIDPSDSELAKFDQDYPQCKVVKGRYLSPWSNKTEKSFTEVFDYFWNRKQNKLRLPNLESTSLKELLQPQNITINNIKNIFSKAINNNSNNIPCTWIGHATCYFELNNIKFITDPVFGDRASPISFYGPKRFFPAGLNINEMVNNNMIDYVLLSHTHYDHMCKESLYSIGNKATWVVPLGVKELLEDDYGITNCIEMNWWDKHIIDIPAPSTSTSTEAEAEALVPKTIEVSFTPAKHWTARHFFDRNTCLWGSFVIHSPEIRMKANQNDHDHNHKHKHNENNDDEIIIPAKKVFFSGDTAYCDVFKKIGKRYGPFDLSFIPIGAYEPRYFMKHHHCNPEEALQIHRDLNSNKSLAIHWGTFPLADEDIVEPALELGRCRDLSSDLTSDDFFTVRIGDTFSVTAGQEYTYETTEITEATEAKSNSMSESDVNSIIEGIVVSPGINDFSLLNSQLQLHYNDHVESKLERAEIQQQKVNKVKNALNVKKKIKKRVASGIAMAKTAKENIKERREKVRESGIAMAKTAKENIKERREKVRERETQTHGQAGTD